MVSVPFESHLAKGSPLREQISAGAAQRAMEVARLTITSVQLIPPGVGYELAKQQEDLNLCCNSESGKTLWF